MLPPDRLPRQDVEDTLISKAFTVAEESDRQVMYSRHAYPGVDIILDYNEDGTIDRGVVQRRLAEEGINDIVFP